MSWFTSKNTISVIILLTFFAPILVSGQTNNSVCDKDGFTILLINGVSTSDSRAAQNKRKLASLLVDNYKGQFINVDILFNPSHFAGLSDALDVVNQKIYENKIVTDYDFLEMWRDASEKVKTQKLLLVGHSQGNFYVNSFYNTLVDKVDGVPSQSFGVYGVASPASYVAGGGKYITSSNDKVIDGVRITGESNVLPNNVNIPVSTKDTLGHDFTEIYMANQGDRIISEILNSLNKLSSNDIQNTNQTCFVRPPSDFTDLVTRGIYMVSDPLAYVSKEVVVATYDGLDYMGNAVLYGVSKTAVFAYNVLDAIGNGIINSTKALAFGIYNIFTYINKDSLPVGGDAVSASVVLAEEPVPEVEKTIIEKPINEVKDPFASGEFQTIVLSEPLVLEDKKEAPAPVVPENVEVYPRPFVQVHNDDPGSPTPVVVSTPAPTPDTTPPVITISGDTNLYITKNSTYTDAGASASDAVDGVVSVSTSGTVDTSTTGTYTITYTATDVAGNTSTASRNVKVSTYVYIPKNTFGTNNGDGNDWQVWTFSGSYIYDWSDTYVNNCLKQNFKIQSLLGYSCGQCLQRGIFNHNPEMGFEPSDVTMSYYENNRPQNGGTGLLYEVTTQWDATGYTYTTMEAGVLYGTGHIDVSNVDQNMYVGWDGSHNNFQTFPSGTYDGFFHPSGYGNPNLPDYFAGSSMVIKPYAVYVP